MRLAISAALGGLLVAFVSPAADPKGEAVTKEQIEADLKLVPKVFGDTRVIEAGTQPYIEFALVNTSKTRAHKVVKPGDGVIGRPPRPVGSRHRRAAHGRGRVGGHAGPCARRVRPVRLGLVEGGNRAEAG